MGHTLTRRQWAGALGAAQALTANAQQRQQPREAAETPAELVAQAKQAVQRNREALAKYKIDRSLEPVTRFEA